MIHINHMHYHVVLYRILYISYHYGVVSVMFEKCAFSDSNFLEDFELLDIFKNVQFSFFQNKV